MSFDLEILNGLDMMADQQSGAIMGYAPGFNPMAGAPSQFNFAGYGPPGYAPVVDPSTGAIMGWNPFSSLAHGVSSLAHGAYNAVNNLAHGRLPSPYAHHAAPHRAFAPRPMLPAYAPQYMAPAAVPQPLSQIVTPIPGVADRGGKVQPLGFNLGTFTATSGTTIVVKARPQRPLRGGRLVGSFSRNGATATGLLTISSLFVGTDGQLLSADPISFDALAPNAFGVGVNFSPAQVGQDISATVNISAAPTMTDTVTFSLTLFGLTIG